MKFLWRNGMDGNYCAYVNVIEERNDADGDELSLWIKFTMFNFFINWYCCSVDSKTMVC